MIVALKIAREYGFESNTVLKGLPVRRGSLPVVLTVKCKRVLKSNFMSFLLKL